ncbi:MFS transporter [Halobacteriales archaeon QS_5_70_15]|nr:MAG: MFS transporter [Halobacteriales archaeon QS_5_70_15]
MLVVATGTLLLSVLVWFNYSAVLPLIVEDWGLSGTKGGIIFGAFQAGYMLAIVPMGMLADRYSPRPVVGGGALGTGVASLAFAGVATGFLSGTALRFVGGMAMAGVYVPGMRFVSDWYPEAERGRAMGVYVGGFSLSSGLSFLLASNIAAAVDWRTAVAATSVGALVAGPVFLVLARESPAAAARDGSGFSLDRSLLRNREYLSAVGVYSFHSWELLGVRNWLLAFLVTAPAVAAGGTSLAGTLVGVTMVVGGAGNLAGGWLSDRLGRARTVMVALAVSGGISATIVALGGLPLPALVAVLLVYGLALTADSSPTSTAVTEAVADDRVGTALSVQSFVGFFATVVSPVVFGVALDVAGFGLAFGTLALGAAAGLVCAAALSRYAAGTSVAPDAA